MYCGCRWLPGGVEKFGDPLPPETLASILRDDPPALVGLSTVSQNFGLAARYAREKKVPYLGLCLGMQVMSVEFARHVLDHEDANSTEFDRSTAAPVIDLMLDQRSISDMGGTMRLGLYPCVLKPGTKAAEAYGAVEEVEERHRHRFEFNNAYRAEFERAGMVFSGISPDGKLVEIAELRDHPYMVGSQFHPEFLSRPMRPHPLFMGLVKAAKEKHTDGNEAAAKEQRLVSRE